MTQLPKIALFALGGTIAMLEPEAGRGGVPKVSPEQLTAAAPGLADIAALSLETLASSASVNLTLDDVARLARAVTAAFADGAAGVVVTQGTDTLEEVAFALELLLDVPGPVVVTGALRRPDQAGCDGPANLLGAVRAAADPACAGAGVLVVMNDEVHAARHVRKTHTFKPDALSSTPFGPLGHVVETGVRLAMRPAGRLPRLAYGAPAPNVPVLWFGLGVGMETLAPWLERQPDGLVVAGVGAGHVTQTVIGGLGELAARIPVVLASRIGAGPTLTQTYGYAGGEVDLIGRGLIPSAYLDPAKARLLLQLLLSSGASIGEVRRTFADL
jgi:L-asparaginase